MESLFGAGSDYDPREARPLARSMFSLSTQSSHAFKCVPGKAPLLDPVLVRVVPFLQE